MTNKITVYAVTVLSNDKIYYKKAKTEMKKKSHKTRYAILLHVV